MNEEPSRHDLPPVVLSVSGLDPTGSAGLIADARVLGSLGCQPVGVVTCETVQSSMGISGIRASDPDLFWEQLHTLMDDVKVQVVKIGALASVETIEILGRELAKRPSIPVILDPVFEPTTGPRFLGKDGMKAMSEYLLNQTLIATPNLRELGAPADLVPGVDDDEMITGCAMGWLSAGVEAVLVTGLERGEEMVDRLIRVGLDSEASVLDIAHPRHRVGEVHGTGCILSSALAGYIAKGEKMVSAVKKASEYTSELIARSRRFGGGASFWIGGSQL